MQGVQQLQNNHINVHQNISTNLWFRSQSLLTGRSRQTIVSSYTTCPLPTEITKPGFLKKGFLFSSQSLRYSHFDDLNKGLKEYFGDTLPSLPKKSYLTFFTGKTHDDIEQRRIGLDLFLKNLVVRQEIFNSLPLREFLELDLHAKEIMVNPPQLICEFKGFIHGVRDFTIQSDQGVMFIVNSDCNVLTRLDAYMTNMKLPWESENGQQTLIPVGCVECWIQGENGEFERSWTKMYNSQAICCNWNPVGCVLLVGLDSGSINYLSVPKGEAFKRYDSSMEIEQHLDRVMGLHFDHAKQLIHSVSKDRKYRVLDLSKEALIADFEPGNFELTYLLVNEERQRSFVGDRCGSIFLFDLSQPKPTPLIHLSTTLKFIRGLFIDTTRNYLFSLGYDEGEIIVFDINKTGKEQYAKEVAKLKNKAKSREIIWSGSRGEIFVGNEDGTVTIWDAKKAAPIYVIKAHSEEITKLIWLEQDQTLLTGGKDKLIKAWRLPLNWRDQKVVDEEEKEAKIALKTKNQVDIQRKQKQNEEDDNGDDDDDELGVWHKNEQREHVDTSKDSELQE